MNLKQKHKLQKDMDSVYPVILKNTRCAECIFFIILTALGSIASFISINIPHTEVFIDAKMIFGFIGFALLKRWYLSIILAIVLSLSGFHKISIEMVLFGNMLYMIPIFITTRFLYERHIKYSKNNIKYGFSWLILVIICYQIFSTPIVWGFSGYIKSQPVFTQIINGWRIQPFIFESTFIAFISTLIMLIIKTNTDLKKSQQELSVTFKSIGDGVITTDNNGYVVIMNSVAEKLTGWKNCEANGKPLSDVFNIVNEFTLKPSANPVKKVLTSEEIVELANHTLLISKTGEKYIIADSGSPIRDSQGNIIGVVLVFRDITEKQKFLEQSQRSEKLNSLGILAGGIAHDFNNLLSGIFGFIEIAKHKSADNKSVQNDLDQALSVFERAKSLTNQLLTFAKGGKPRIKKGDVIQVVKESVLFALSGSNIRAEFNFEENLWQCGFDKHQISQVIDNIVINATQTRPKTEKINISINNHRFKANRQKQTNFENYIKISIKDYGPGIDPKILNNIFDPFFTTKHNGSGLGLATSYSIIQKHNGFIDVKSVKNKGTEFIIYLPASVEVHKQKTLEKSNQIDPKNIRNIQNVLIMDDEDYMRILLSEMISNLGINPITAKNGEQVLEIIKEKNNIDAVILDLTVTGGLGGKETVKEIKKIYPDMRVYVSSGYSDDPVMADPKGFSFNGSLKKPYKLSDLKKLLYDI